MSNESFEESLSAIRIINDYSEKGASVIGSRCSERSTVETIQSAQILEEVYPEIWCCDDESTQIDEWANIPNEQYKAKYSEERIIDCFRKQSNPTFKLMQDKELNHLVSLVLEHERLVSLGLINDIDELKSFRNELFLVIDAGFTHKHGQAS